MDFCVITSWRVSDLHISLTLQKVRDKFGVYKVNDFSCMDIMSFSVLHELVSGGKSNLFFVQQN